MEASYNQPHKFVKEISFLKQVSTEKKSDNHQ